MNQLKLKYFLALLLFAASFPTLHAQLGISPPYVSIDEKSGVGNLYITNNSEQSQEVGISFAFGYPASDADGNLVMNYSDSVAFEQYALDPQIRAFPRSFILPPKQMRTVRIQVRPTPAMQDGFYFTRAKILAMPQTPEVAKEVTEGITTRITFNFEQVIPAFYKRGKVSTGLTIEKVDVAQQDGKLIVMPHLNRTGNAPFIGSMAVKLLDSKGKVVTESQASTTAYFNVVRRADLDLAKVTPGKYQLELTFETNRGDMAAGDLVQAQPVREVVDVVIK
jgi:hypothetical protein